MTNKLVSTTVYERQRQTQACDRCRARKRKCDDTVQCSSCTKANIKCIRNSSQNKRGPKGPRKHKKKGTCSDSIIAEQNSHLDVTGDSETKYSPSNEIGTAFHLESDQKRIVNQGNESYVTTGLDESSDMNVFSSLQKLDSTLASTQAQSEESQYPLDSFTILPQSFSSGNGDELTNPYINDERYNEYLLNQFTLDDIYGDEKKLSKDSVPFSSTNWDQIFVGYDFNASGNENTLESSYENGQSDTNQVSNSANTVSDFSNIPGPESEDFLLHPDNLLLGEGDLADYLAQIEDMYLL